MARYLVNGDGSIWLFRSEEAFCEYAELRSRGFDKYRQPEDFGAELLGTSVTNHSDFAEWRSGNWKSKKARLPGEGYEESDVDPDMVIAMVHDMNHPSAPLPWKPGQLEEFPANKFILSQKTGKVVAQVYWMGMHGQALLAAAPELLLSLCREVKRLRSLIAEMKE